MSDLSVRRPLAISATIATSVAVAVGALAPMANATSASPGGAAKLTLSNGAKTIDVGGTAVTVPGGSTATDVAWAPDGSRYAYVDTNQNIVVASVSGGPTVTLTNPVGPGGKRSHPTWAQGGTRLIWAELPSSSASWGLKYAAANGTDTSDGTKTGTPVTYDLVPAGLGTGNLEFPDAVTTPSGDDVLAFQFTAAGITDVVVVTQPASGAPSTTKVIAPGFQASVSADGKQLAFVAADGNKINQIFTTSIANLSAVPAPKAVTAATANNTYAHPVWAPDGKSIVFESQDPTTVQDVDTKTVKIGSTTETPLGSAPTLGLPAFQPQVRDSVTRLAGDDRLATAVAVSKSVWGTAGSGKGSQANAVVLTRSDQPADALGGSALAAKVGGPLLLTQTASLNPAVQTEITRVLGAGSAGKTVYILGGLAAVSQGVETGLTKAGYTVVRVAGKDRFETAVAIANKITDNKAPNVILVATGMNYADALSAGAAAGAINARGRQTAVVLLTNDKVMPKPTIDYIVPLNAQTNLDANHQRPANFIELDTIGGQAEAAVLHPVVSWIPVGSSGGTVTSVMTGSDRYNTSYLVARRFFGPGTGTVGLATGMNWADALSGGALMGTAGGPMILINPVTGPNGDVAAWLADSSGAIGHALVFGGTAAVGAGVTGQVGQLIDGPAGFDSVSDPAVG